MMNAASDNMVIKPHENDVLCGRGGLTNHHPGNEWYRRLVRSNRPLYRACPKHTKLLISKAIVQAVQNQEPSGRFLECSKSNGLWFPVPYKRAVDKTSQALREREKDETGAPGPTIKPSALPAMLQGRGKRTPPDLNHLAQVALATAGLEQKKAPVLRTPVVPPVQPQPQPQTIPHVAAAATLKRPLETPAPSPGSTGWFAGVPKKRRLDEDDPEPVPLPTPPLQVRQSSMFRWLAHNRFFGGSSPPAPSAAAAAASGGAAAAAMFLQHQQQQQQQTAQQITSATDTRVFSSAASDKSEQPSGGHSFPNNFSAFANAAAGGNFDTSNNSNNMPSASPSQINVSAEMLAMMNRPRWNSGGPTGTSPTNLLPPPQPILAKCESTSLEAVPPALSRLTTQVSDWLTSFWPLPVEKSSEKSSPPNNFPQSNAFGRGGPSAVGGGQMQMVHPASMVTNAHNSSGSQLGTINTSGNLGTSSWGGGNSAMNQGFVGMSSFASQNSTGMSAGSMSLFQDNTGVAASMPSETTGGGMAPPMSQNNGSDISGSMGAPSTSNMQGGMASLGNTNNTGMSLGMRSAIADVQLREVPPRDDRSISQRGPRTSDHVPLTSDRPRNAMGAPLPPGPSELERSVSATLLTLASTPSKLFSGLSNFFERNPSTAQGGSSIGGSNMQQQQSQQEAPPPPPPQHPAMMNGGVPTLGPPDVGRPPSLGRPTPRHNSGSLLDDYEESAVETRLRTVTSR